MKIPLNGEAATKAYFNVPPLIAVPSWVTSELNFDFELAFAGSDEVFPLFPLLAFPHAANVTAAAAADKNNKLFFFIFPPLSDFKSILTSDELSDKLILDVNFNRILIICKKNLYSFLTLF